MCHSYSSIVPCYVSCKNSIHILGHVDANHDLLAFGLSSCANIVIVPCNVSCKNPIHILGHVDANLEIKICWLLGCPRVP